MKSLDELTKTRTVIVNCPTHGEQEVHQIALFLDFDDPVCPVCDAEQQRLKAEAEARQLQADEQRNNLARIETQLSRACIPLRFYNKTFATYEATNPAMTNAMHICQGYADRFPAMLKGGVSIILCGNTGTGKTHLANAIALQVISEHRKTALYVTVGRALRKVKETFSKASTQTEQQAIESFRAPDLLILDEVGVQYGSETEKNILFEIVNERYEAMKPTILISNLALGALKDFTGDRVLDRMKENGGKLIVFDWKSKRGSE